MDPHISLPEWQILSDPTLNSLPFQETVLDHPTVNTRASLYIYLNAHLHSHPSLSDASILTFLNTRYNEDIPALVSDLILASFDVLANAAYRSSPARFVTLIRSFLANKLPVFLQTHYAALIFEPLTIEQCIRQALGRIDPSAFPSFSQMFDFSSSSGNSTVSEARQEFLFACALHGLIQEQSIEEILGDVPMQSLPAGGRYSKAELVSQCTVASARIEQYVGELENMEGNAGEIAGAVVEILHTLCANSETVTLRGLCNTLLRKPAALDVVLLFTSSRDLLQPLVRILDGRLDHDDQGEYQPVYEEFGSLLLFVVGVQHQYRFNWEDLGIESPNSFVQQYLRTSSASRSLEELSSHENEILGAWIKGLFETESISDELMSMCKPQEFHLLVATLFDQSLKACQAGVLPLETLKAGFEYLLEPFLLPSLIAGLTWFADRLRESMEQQALTVDSLLPALQALLKPPSISGDASEIHNSVLCIVAKPLKASLTHVQRAHSSRPDIPSLLQIVNPLYDERPALNALKEVQNWSTTPHGGLQAALRNTLAVLVVWSAPSASSADMSPPSYTHSQLHESVAILGAKSVLDVFLLELLSPDNSPTNAEILLDIIAVMIVSTSPPPSSTGQARNPTLRLTLYDTLQIEYQYASALSSTDLARATMIVRLHRRVDALLGRKVAVGTGVNVEVGVGNGPFMDGVVRNAEGQPTTDIDDVLAVAGKETEEALASGGFGIGEGVGEGLLGIA